MTKYYRVISEYKGEQTEFLPKNSYEQVEMRNGISRLIEPQKSKIKEVCFSKNVLGCLFAINMFLEEGDYFIYQTRESPSIDLSNSDVGDFPATEEVRYREAVKGEYYGKIFVSSYLIHCLRETYEECNHGNIFDFEKARKELERFTKVNSEVVLA